MTLKEAYAAGGYPIPEGSVIIYQNSTMYCVTEKQTWAFWGTYHNRPSDPH